MTATLAQRLLAANKDLGWVAKSGKNKDQGYNYVEAVAIFDAVRDALTTHGVVFSHSVFGQTVTVIPREGKSPQFLTELRGGYVFINADDKNDVQAGEWAGQALDTSDKGTWKAITGGLKYIFIANHLLPTGDDPENDASETTKSAPPKAVTPIPTGTKVTEKVKPEASESSDGLTPKQIAKLQATFRDAGLTVSESRQYAAHKLVGKRSVKQMNSDDMDKIIAFLVPKTDASEALVAEAMAQVAA